VTDTKLELSETPELSADNVREVLLYCLFNNDELIFGRPIVPVVSVEGIVYNFGFHKERLEECRAKVAHMISKLSSRFQKGDPSGGGSFLQMCVDHNGKQWGEQRSTQELLVLGIGLEILEIPWPRRMWKLLPGGVPHVVPYGSERPITELPDGAMYEGGG